MPVQGVVREWHSQAVPQRASERIAPVPVRLATSGRAMRRASSDDRSSLFEVVDRDDEPVV
jgi:hypothetical protein